MTKINKQKRLMIFAKEEYGSVDKRNVDKDNRNSKNNLSLTTR